MSLVLGRILPAAIGAGVNIWANRKARKEQSKIAKQQRGMIESDRDRDLQDATDYFNQNYYTNFTDTAEGRNMLNNMGDMYRRAYQTRLLAGGTQSPEAALAMQAQQSGQMADATASMAAMGTQRKANLRDQFEANRNRVNNAYSNAMHNIYSQDFNKWNNFANAGAQAGNSIMGMAGLDWKGMFGKGTPTAPTAPAAAGVSVTQPLYGFANNPLPKLNLPHINLTQIKQ